MATLERYHTEDNAWRERHLSGDHRAMEARIVALERSQDRTDVRLHDGASTFAAIKLEVEAVKKTTTMPIWKIAIIVFAIISPVAAVAFNAARYPDRGEFERLKGQVDSLRFDEAQHHTELKGAIDGLTRAIDGVTRKQP